MVFFEFSVDLYDVLRCFRQICLSPANFRQSPMKVFVWFCFCFWYFRRGLPVAGKFCLSPTNFQWVSGVPPAKASVLGIGFCFWSFRHGRLVSREAPARLQRRFLFVFFFFFFCGEIGSTVRALRWDTIGLGVLWWVSTSSCCFPARSGVFRWDPIAYCSFQRVFDWRWNVSKFPCYFYKSLYCVLQVFQLEGEC